MSGWSVHAPIETVMARMCTHAFSAPASDFVPTCVLTVVMLGAYRARDGLQINTIEREIEQLSERLSGQPHHANSNSTTRLRRASSHDDLPGEESFHGRDGREQGSVAKGMGVTSGTVGKRLRVRSSVVSSSNS